MAEFTTNTDLSTQFAANSRIWPEPLNSGGQTLAQWLADGGTNTEANFTPVRASAGGRLTSDGDSILFGNVAGNTPRSNIAVTANLAALRIIEDAGSGNSFFGDRWNGTGSGSGTGNSITITNSQIHGSSTGGNFNNSITDVTLTNVEWFQAGTATSFIGNWGAGGSPTSTWTLNGLRCFGETETRIARLGILLGNTTDQSVFNNVDFYDGVPATPRGAYLETFVLQTWENTRLGPLGREFNLDGNRIDGGGGPGDDRLLARFSVRSTGQGSGAGTTPLLGWDWRDVSMVDDVNFIIGIDTQADNLVGGMVFVNPLIGRPGGTGEMIVRNIRGTTGAVDLTVPYLMATRPVTTDTGNPHHTYIPVESTRNVMAFPATFTNQTIFANQNNGVINNPANGLLFEVRTDNITAGQTTTDTTGQLFPAFGAMQYRKYSWQQQPDNTTFGSMQTITPPAEGATDEQVTTSRGNGYSEIAGGVLTTMTNVDDPEDTLIAGLNISYATGRTLTDTQGGITNLDQLVAGLKAFTINRQARGAHEDLPYTYAGNVLTVNAPMQFSASATALSIPAADTHRINAAATLALGATINTLIAANGEFINFTNSVSPAAGMTLGGVISGLPSTVPQITVLDGTRLGFPGVAELDFTNVTLPDAPGTITVDTGGSVEISGVPAAMQARIVAAQGTTITFAAVAADYLFTSGDLEGWFAVRNTTKNLNLLGTTRVTAGTPQVATVRNNNAAMIEVGDVIRIYYKAFNTSTAGYSTSIRDYTVPAIDADTPVSVTETVIPPILYTTNAEATYTGASADAVANGAGIRITLTNAILSGANLTGARTQNLLQTVTNLENYFTQMVTQERVADFIVNEVQAISADDVAFASSSATVQQQLQAISGNFTIDELSSYPGVPSVTIANNPDGISIDDSRAAATLALQEYNAATRADVYGASQL